jgi:hypothetical protein
VAAVLEARWSNRSTTTLDSRAASGGLNSLKRHATGTRDLTQFLAKQDAYTIHRPARMRFERRKTYSKGINDLFQTDIVDMSNVATYNNSYRYLLTCIDVFSKYAWAVPLRTKAGREVSLAFEEKILSERTCRMVQSDKGTEYTNSVFQSMLAKHGIHHYTSENDDIKAAVIERWNRTLKERIYRYFTYKNTRRYIDVLNDIVYSLQQHVSQVDWHDTVAGRQSERTDRARSTLPRETQEIQI